MTFMEDLKTSRAMQIRVVLGLVVGILWFAFAISQFIRVSNARSTPLFVLAMPPLQTDSTPAPASVMLPSFAVCAAVGDKPPDVVCNFHRDGSVRTCPEKANLTR